MEYVLDMPILYPWFIEYEFVLELISRFIKLKYGSYLIVMHLFYRIFILVVLNFLVRVEIK